MPELLGFLFVVACFTVAFCYGTLAIAVIFGGHDRLPLRLQALLEYNDRRSVTRAGRIGAVVTTIIWILLVVAPQLVLVREVFMTERAFPEKAVAAAGLSLSVGWVAFLTALYRRPTNSRGHSAGDDAAREPPRMPPAA